jgi:virginiamycin B lyase
MKLHAIRGQLCGAASFAALAIAASACSGVSNGNAVPALGSAAQPFPQHAKAPLRIREFADLPQSYGDYYPTAVTIGPDNAIWVTDNIDQDYGECVVARIAPSGKQEQTFYYQGLSTEGASFGDITTGSDGALWITDSYNDQILRLTTGGTYTGFQLKDGDPSGIVAGPDKALWFTTYSAIGRITTKGVITMYGASGALYDIAVGPDGALWFTEYAGNQIGRITTHGKITLYSKGISPGAGPESIAPGPDGALWFTENAGGRIGRITTGGKVTEYSSGITPTEEPVDLVAGSDGAMWFTEYESYDSYSIRESKIGRITTSGKITEYSVTDSSAGPTGIVKGVKGDLWFVESAVDRMGRVRL